MTRRKRMLASVSVVILSGLAGWAFYEYQKPHTGAGDKTTDVKIDAVSLYQEFSKNETAANGKYLDKIIEVTGTIDDIQETNGALVITLNANQPMGGISCKMFFANNNSFKKGQQITIKGKCAGLLSDVTLVDGVRLGK